MLPTFPPSLQQRSGEFRWLAVYDNPNIWHSRFNGPTPKALVRAASWQSKPNRAHSSWARIRGHVSRPICDTGHWLMAERPNETMNALVKFLTQ